jgi:hypothetical protein
MGSYFSRTAEISSGASTEDLTAWAHGPSLESLFGDAFPLARDHPDWKKLEEGEHYFS